MPPAGCSPAPPQPGGPRTSLEQMLLAGSSARLLKLIPQKLKNAWPPQLGSGDFSSVKKKDKKPNKPNINPTGPGPQGFGCSKTQK